MTATATPPAPAATVTPRQGKSVFTPEILWPAIGASLHKLDPRVQVRNPVMFVVEVGALITTIAWIARRSAATRRWFTFTIAVWLWLTVVFANLAEALAEGRGRAQAASLRAMRSETTARLVDGRARSAASQLQRGDIVVVEAGEVIPGDGTVDRGHRLRRRVGDHRRVGAGHPRVRRRPQRRHRRHARALRPHRGRDHPGARPVVPGPHDRAGRGRRAAQDAERDRAQHPARGADAGLPVRDRGAQAVRRVREHRRSPSRR